MTDPIADLLTRMRNAVKARQAKTVAPYSKLKTSILDVMKKRHFISGYKVVKNGTFNEIEIEFNPDLNSFNLKRVSKPGRRIYMKKNNIKPVVHGYGISIFSTPQGVMAGDEAAKKGMGGEYLCQIW
ncbi:30S ribosomal protein S8 [Candidatus Peregrinibacteria bacterium]|nr:30S ribosomal protein S8 [Candidatus Peregrinibacteria bacterium]